MRRREGFEAREREEGGRVNVVNAAQGREKE